MNSMILEEFEQTLSERMAGRGMSNRVKLNETAGGGNGKST